MRQLCRHAADCGHAVGRCSLAVEPHAPHDWQAEGLLTADPPTFHCPGIPPDGRKVGGADDPGLARDVEERYMAEVKKTSPGSALLGFAIGLLALAVVWLAVFAAFAGIYLAFRALWNAVGL